MPINSSFKLRILCSVVLGTSLMVGCAANVSKHNVEHVQKVDNESHALITERIRVESKKLFEQSDKLQKQITQTKAVVIVPVAIEPVFDPLDAINVTIDADNSDVQNILRVLAEQAGMSLLLDPELAEISRKVSMHLDDVPASLVFANILELLDLNGIVKSNMLIVRPFKEMIYSLDFLQTKGTLDFSMGGDVFGANKNVGSGSGSGGGGNSNSMVGNLSLTGSGSTFNNPYQQLNDMLEEVIGKQQNNQQVEDNTAPGVANGGGEKKGTKPSFSLNEMTGTLYVKARPSQVKTITKLVNIYKDVLQRQVLIEAQILDVRLTEQFQHGVDWSLLRKELIGNYGSGQGIVGGLTTNIPDVVASARSVILPAGTIGNELGRAFSAVTSNGTFTAAINMLQGFGTVRVLSNPSVRAKNARPAFMSVGQNTQYISESTVTVNNLGGSSTTTADVTTSSAFNGIILGVEPFIADDGTINLTIHPMQSEVDKNSLILIDAGGGSKVTLPVIDFKGLVTSLSLNDGDTVILGGLIDEVGADNGDGIPGLNNIPAIGNLFGGRAMNKQSRELVIILRVTRI
ncbi:MAG: MSHA type pilus biogenesis protein MshL [Congregibacter sp.]|jgi:MSHA type pilus biogenesis protein MshL